MIKSKKEQFFTYFFLVVGAIVLFFPIIFSLGLSFTSNTDILNGRYVPTSINFENYINAFKAQPFLHYIMNSLITALATAAGQIILALLSAYAIVFVDFKGKNIVFALFMATMMIPSEVLVISNFNTIRNWNLMNTFPGLILPVLSSTFGIFLLRQSLKQIPWELKEASQISGVSNFYFFRKVVIPMTRNSIATLGIYSFLVSWNSYMWPLLSTNTETVRTVQIGLRNLRSHDGATDLGMVAAGAIIASIPTLLIIFFGQRRMQEGLAKGALR